MADKTSTIKRKISGIERAVALGLLGLVGFAVISSLVSLQGLRTEYSVSQFLPESHPLMENDEALRKKFAIDLMSPILATVELQNDSWLKADRLEALGAATRSLSGLEEIKGAISLGTVEVAASSDDELRVIPLASIADESERVARIKSDRFLSPTLVSNDAKRALIVLSLQEEYTNETLGALIGEVRSRLGSHLPSDAKVSIGGVPALQTRFSSLVQSELVLFMALGLVASCLTLFFVFSSLSSLVIPLVSIFIANILVLGFMVLSGISLSVLAVTIPILVSVVVLALCIHVLLRFVEDEGHVAKPKAKLSFKATWVLTTLGELAFPTFLISVIAAVGFGALTLTRVPIIQDFSIAVGASLVISWLSTMLVLGPLMLLLPAPKARTWVMAEAKWMDWVFRLARPIVGVTIIGCAALAVLGTSLHWSARLFDDLPLKDEARVATEKIDKDLGGMIPFDILVTHPDGAEAWNDPALLRALDQAVEKIRLAPEVGSAVSLPDLFRLSVGDPRAEIPDNRAAIAEAWFVMGMSADTMLKKYLSHDGSVARIEARLHDIEGDRMEATTTALIKSVTATFPGAKIETRGLATTVHQLNNELSRALMIGFWHALFVIGVFLIFVFRSWRWTLLAVLPNLVPAAVLIGILSLAGTPIKPGVAIVFSVALGLAFNNTVYLLQRLRVLMRKNETSAVEEIEKTMRLEGNPCLVASLSLLSGFAIFVASEFGINQTFGVYMLISLFFGLVGDLALLPALVKVFPKFLVSTAQPRQEKLASVYPVGNPVEEEMQLESGREESFLPRSAASILAFMIAFSPVTSAVAAPDAKTILKKVEQNLSAKDESAVVKMKVIESNGSSKERELEIKRKSGGKHQVLVRLRAPSDVSGVAFLSITNGSREDQWLYMPSQKKARRVVSGNKSQRFLDTEFNLEDFSASTYARFDNKVIKEERAPSASVAVIESKARGEESSYSKILTWIDLNSYQVQKSEYYDRDGKLLKTMVFRDYKKYGSAWRARTIEVRNMQNQRSTVLQMAALKVNSGLSDREFTQGALERGD